MAETVNNAQIVQEVKRKLIGVGGGSRLAKKITLDTTHHALGPAASCEQPVLFDVNNLAQSGTIFSDLLGEVKLDAPVADIKLEPTANLPEVMQPQQQMGPVYQHQHQQEDALSRSLPIPKPSTELNDLLSFASSGSFPYGSSSFGSSYTEAPVWSPILEPPPPVKMEDEDMFPMERTDLFPDPTLTQINTNEESLFDDFINFDDFLSTDTNRGVAVYASQECCPPQQLLADVSPTPTRPVPYHPTSSPAPLPELVLSKETPPDPRLSSSAPTSHLTEEEIWQHRREPRTRLLSTSSLSEVPLTITTTNMGSSSSINTGSVLSPSSLEGLSHDETVGSDRESDKEEESSDVESHGSDENDLPTSIVSSGGSKKERYFWQYNVQAKGPKGQRIVLSKVPKDPHILYKVVDPVFSTQCAIEGIKHSGKARRGDGNDLTPNPHKLYSIGKELHNLNKIINDMTPVSELPSQTRPTSRKEKNKLASRACRLKKKAQHEANKLKLYGLENEHKRLLTTIVEAREIMVQKIEGKLDDDISDKISSMAKHVHRSKIAGSCADFVNKVLENIEAGVPNGGLESV